MAAPVRRPSCCRVRVPVYGTNAPHGQMAGSRTDEMSGRNGVEVAGEGSAEKVRRQVIQKSCRLPCMGNKRVARTRHRRQSLERPARGRVFAVARVVPSCSVTLCAPQCGARVAGVIVAQERFGRRQRLHACPRKAWGAWWYVKPAKSGG